MRSGSISWRLWSNFVGLQMYRNCYRSFWKDRASFAVYREMDPDRKGDLAAIKRALTDAFRSKPFRFMNS